MVNNKPYDESCFKKAKQNQKNAFTHTIIDHRFPDPSVSITTAPSSSEMKFSNEKASAAHSPASRTINAEHINGETFTFGNKILTATNYNDTEATSSRCNTTADKQRKDDKK
ncbi:unnamed protein product [Toxocara canis]|uniref:Uncharacterized protein n=1 Tax=Toxocara canis TaxID=6265 RepID=A0A183U8Q4_TOXCA|nr:unnamed protein product [Toxocara canis]